MKKGPRIWEWALAWALTFVGIIAVLLWVTACPAPTETVTVHDTVTVTDTLAVLTPGVLDDRRFCLIELDYDPADGTGRHLTLADAWLPAASWCWQGAPRDSLWGEAFIAFRCFPAYACWTEGGTNPYPIWLFLAGCADYSRQPETCVPWTWRGKYGVVSRFPGLTFLEFYLARLVRYGGEWPAWGIYQVGAASMVYDFTFDPEGASIHLTFAAVEPVAVSLTPATEAFPSQAARAVLP